MYIVKNGGTVYGLFASRADAQRWIDERTVTGVHWVIFEVLQAHEPYAVQMPY